jgi:hypothetical protein
MLRKFALLLGAVGALALSQPAFADTPCCVVGPIVSEAGQNAVAVSLGMYGGNYYLVWEDASYNMYIAKYNLATHAYEGKTQLNMNGLGYDSFAIAGNNHGLYIAVWTKQVQAVSILQIGLSGTSPTGKISGQTSVPWQGSGPLGLANLNGDLIVYAAQAMNSTTPPGFASVGTTASSQKSMKK